ncbi:hypothetical protein [Rhizobium sp. BR 314]|uniref:hypothetical protein n=1 Tax=Rhizobium sp. BR 314 TaxID=3040013 RepID=UPI0039BEFD5F
MIETHATNLAESVRILVHSSDEKHHRRAASAKVAKIQPKRQFPDREIREKRTFWAMLAFGLLLGGLELFIVLHYL